MSPETDWREGVGILRERLRILPERLRECAREPVRSLDLDLAGVRRFVATGVGSSAAHAKLLVHLLEESGCAASFRPLSAFLGRPGSADDVLVVFSQGLSPNARLALVEPERWRRVVLVTAAEGEAAVPGVLVCRLPVGSERGTLVRVVGPACGIWTAIALARSLAGSSSPGVRIPEVAAGDVCEAMARAAERAAARAVPECLEDLVLVTSGSYGALVGNLQAKVLEGMLRPWPPVFDLLELAHGPFQQASGRRASFVVLARRDAPGERELLARLRSMLDPALHGLVVLEAELPGPFALFEHEAMLNEWMLRDIEARGVDQVRWPGRDADRPLYGVNGTGSGSRRLERLTWPEIERLLAAGCRTAVVPLGSTEQHGPHLSFATDSWIAEALAERFCGRVPEAVQMPVLTIGCSPEHLDFPGTLSLRAGTLAAILGDVLDSLRAHGFEAAFLFSAHGGNLEAVREALPGLRRASSPLRVTAFTDAERLTTAMQAVASSFGVGPEASGHHAGELETSILLALDPLAVRRERLEPGRLEPAADAQSLFYPSLRQNAPDGTVGDPRAADPVRAEAYLSRWVDLLVESWRAANAPG